MSNQHQHKDTPAQQTGEAHGDRPDGHNDGEPAATDASFIAQFSRSLADQLKRRGTDDREDPSSRLPHTRRGTFAALSVPNYRRYFAGQAVSMIGTWMQATAQSWLVLTLTHSSTALGVVVGLQTLPLLLLAPYGGVIADRLDKRRLMIALANRDGRPSADPRRADPDRVGARLAGRPARRAARHQHRVRQPRRAIVHARAGQQRAPAQRRHPQRRAGERGAHPRPGDRRDPARHHWRQRVLPAQRGQLRAGHRVARDARPLRAHPHRTGVPHARAASRGAALRALERRARRPAADDGRRRIAHLRVSNLAAGDAQQGTSRRSRRLRVHDRSDGHRRRARRSHPRLARQDRNQAARAPPQLASAPR